MTQIKKRFLVYSLFVALFTLAARAEASPMGAYASFDWSGFQITSYDIYGTGAPVWSLYNQEKSVYVWSQWANDDDYASDWSTPISAQVVGASALDDGSALSAEAVSGDASGYRDANIDISGSGLLVFSIPYEFSITDSYQYVGANLYLWDDNQNLTHDTYIWYDTIGDYSGTLQLALLVSDGDTFSFEAGLTASASPIPLPSSLIFLGIGLGGLLVGARRKKGQQ